MFTGYIRRFHRRTMQKLHEMRQPKYLQSRSTMIRSQRVYGSNPYDRFDPNCSVPFATSHTRQPLGEILLVIGLTILS